MVDTELPPPCIQIGDQVLQFERDELGEEYEELARNELRETEDIVSNAIAVLKDLLRDDDDLFFPLDDEDFLITFLRPCKFYPESAYDRMKKFYKFRVNNPKIFGKLVPSTIKTPILQEGLLTILPQRSQLGRRIFIVRVGKWKVKNVSLVELFRCVMLLVEIAITEYRTQIAGVDVIFDLEGLSLQQIYQFSPFFASNALHWAQECVPLRLKSAHIVNQSYVFNMLFAIFKPFLNEKFRNRIYFHGKDYTSLLSYIDGKYMPKRYGGELDIPDFDRMELFRLLCCYEDQFEERTKYGYPNKNT